MLVGPHFLDCLLGHDVPGCEEYLSPCTPISTRGRCRNLSFVGQGTDGCGDALGEEGPSRKFGLVPAVGDRLETGGLGGSGGGNGRKVVPS